MKGRTRRQQGAGLKSRRGYGPVALRQDACAAPSSSLSASPRRSSVRHQGRGRARAGHAQHRRSSSRHRCTGAQFVPAGGQRHLSEAGSRRRPQPLTERPQDVHAPPHVGRRGRIGFRRTGLTPSRRPPDPSAWSPGTASNRAVAIASSSVAVRLPSTATGVFINQAAVSATVAGGVTGKVRSPSRQEQSSISSCSRPDTNHPTTGGSGLAGVLRGSGRWNVPGQVV